MRANVRELMGSLTQARVQMKAAMSILEDELVEKTTVMASDDEEGQKEIAAINLDMQKLSRSSDVVKDVRDRIDALLNRPSQVGPPKE